MIDRDADGRRWSRGIPSASSLLGLVILLFVARLPMSKLSIGITLSFCYTMVYADPLSGCVNSPENPTLILGMIGLAGAITPWLSKQVRRRLQHKKAQKKMCDQ